MSIIFVLAVVFTPPCKLPFASIAQKQPIDSKCGMSGSPTNTPALAAQDTAKNNFCATGTPVVLTFDAFMTLQSAAVKVLGDNYAPPESRTELHDIVTYNGKKIGEGNVVSVVGFVESAHYSDTSTGESVNCDLTGDGNNDIHIPLVQTAGANECTSVTAEISPHERPSVWTATNINQPKVPMRFTGQLFFDAEHKPCHGTTVDDPPRESGWEVHPVYAIDVCTAGTTLAQCDGGNAKAWMALDAWVKGQIAQRN